MDLATVIGLVGAFGLIVASIIMGGSVGAFIDVPSILVVIGGTIMSTLVMFPMGVAIGSIKVALKAFFTKPYDPDPIITQIVQLAEVARKESLVAMEKVSVDNEFMAKGVRLAADGSSPEFVMSVMESEINYLKQRHKRGQTVFKGMGTAAPAFGMIGTLIGLVNMLQNLSDPASIGPAMAVALLTTFYGAVMANVIFLPIVVKLEARSAEEAFFMEVIMEGVLSIQNGDHPSLVKEKLMGFLSPAMRENS